MDANVVQNGVRNTGINVLGALFLEQIGGIRQGAGRFGQIIHHEHVFAPDFANYRHGFDVRGAFASFGDDGQARFEDLRIGIGHLQSPHIRAHHYQV